MSSNEPNNTRIASLNASAYAFERAAQKDGFSFSDAAFERAKRRSVLLASIIKNLTSDCRTGAAIEIRPVEQAPFDGKSDAGGAGPFDYEGKVSVRDRTMYLDLTLDRGGRRIKISAEVSEDGTFKQYSEQKQ